ncbi:hypothetical protein NE865_07540 [Phthorimaea operculella]|nr:hypothetical protein NE865_07540 [Phthorimaea operculella]
MPDKILENLLSGQLDLELVLTWLRGDNLEDAGDECPLRHCGRNDFTAYFLSYLRAETDSIVDNDSGLRAAIGTGTPERSDGRAHRRAASDPTAESPARPHHSPNRDKKRSGRKVKTKLFTEERNKDPASPDDAKLTAGIDRLALASSTPLKNDSIVSSSRGDSTRSPLLTPSDRPRHSRHEHTFGDFLTTASTSKVKKKRNSRASDDSSQDISVDGTPNSTNNSGRKSSSLRSEKRRIKPTNIDLSKKSISLTSFNNEFQKVGALALENNEVFSAPPQLHGESFSGSPGFAAERDALRRERHRLLEKFSSLSAATSPKCSTPLIKISQEEENYILPDITKVTFEETIQVLVNVYQVLLDCNMALSYTSELCFMLALLRGKQRVDGNVSVSDPRHVLRSVHNAACFAARTLRTQRSILSTLLDRPSLRALAEARATKAMAPDLSKSLLDVYGVRGDTQAESSSSSLPTSTQAGHVVAWNAETDGADNFPSTLSFHSFKKQRDMFYEIARWYDETGGSTTVAGPSLRTRVRALLAAGAAGGHTNLAHLGVLVARHAIATVSGGGAGQESRLSKLQRRLTQRPAHQQNSLFTPEEEFYRELLSCSENEPFRAAVRDALATELLALDAAPVHTGAALVSISRRAATLAKLLGLLAALPYCPQHQPVTSRQNRPLPYILALRSYAQPALDVQSAVTAAAVSGRLCVSVPWVCAYLCTLAASDAAAPRLPPYLSVLRLLRTIYRRRVPCLPMRCALYLRCTLSTLFAHANIPQELLYEDETDECELSTNANGLDFADIITEAELAVLLGARKEVATLLSDGATGSGGPRHVTPLRVGPSPNRATQRHTLIQKRLEEAVVRGCGGAGARRVLELVCERVAAAALTNCTRLLAQHRHKGVPCDVTDIRSLGSDIRKQLEAALGALLSERGGRAALCALAERAVRARLARHTREPGELCDAASAALRTLVSTSWSEETSTTTTSVPQSPTLLTKRETDQHKVPQSPTAMTKTVPQSQTVAPNAYSSDKISAPIAYSSDKTSSPFTHISNKSRESQPKVAQTPASAAKVEKEQSKVIVKQDKDLATALIDLKECICLIVEGSAPSNSVLCSTLEAVEIAGTSSVRGVKRAAVQLSLELCVALVLFSTLEAVEIAGTSSVRGVKRAAVQLSLELCVALACCQPTSLTDAILRSVEQVWSACIPTPSRSAPPNFDPPDRGEGGSRAPTPVSDDEGPTRPPEIVIVAPTAVNDKGPESEQEELIDIFARLVSPRVVRQVSRHGANSWDALRKLVLWATERGWLCPNKLTESCVALYRRDWPQEVLSPLSVWLRDVGAAISQPQLALFLGFLGEYCDDLLVPDD